MPLNNFTRRDILDLRREVMPYVVQNLRAAYGVPEREMNLDPLDVLIGAILSQATTWVNSRRTYEALKNRFPTWEAARRARPSSIEASIRLGGLARLKSIRIKKLLNEIHARFGSLDLSFLCSAPLEEAKQLLGALNGVGPITVACTLLFACNRPVFPVDTHILRIGKRLGILPRTCSDQEAHRLMSQLAPPNRYYEVHINLIRHGREVCRPKTPLCERCCLVDYCAFYAN